VPDRTTWVRVPIKISDLEIILSYDYHKYVSNGQAYSKLRAVQIGIKCKRLSDFPAVALRELLLVCSCPQIT
jgi:hypothetical protein